MLLFCLFPFLKICSNPYFYSVFSKSHIFVAHPQKLGTLFVNTTALTEFFVCPFFCIFAFWVFCCVRFFGVFFWKEWKTQNNQERNKTTRCKPENHLVLFTKKESRQHRHKTMQLHCLDCKQTTQEKTRTKTLSIKTNYLLTNLTSKTQKSRENNALFIDGKQNKKHDKKQNKKTPKTKQHRNKKAETHTMKSKTKQRQKKTSQKWKQPGFKKGMLGKFVQ